MAALGAVDVERLSQREGDAVFGLRHIAIQPDIEMFEIAADCRHQPGIARQDQQLLGQVVSEKSAPA